MCGILGHTHTISLKNCLQHRGPNNTTTIQTPHFSLTHNLLSIVNNVEQPLQSTKSIFGANCEIYNWKKLRPDAENDADALHKHIDKKGITKNALKQLRGPYAFFYYNKNTQKLILARDHLGRKPLWYTHTKKGFAFASERKALQHLPSQHTKELHPRHTLTYNPETNTVKTTHREFYELPQKYPHKKLQQNQEDTEKLLTQAVQRRLPQKDFGILFSGGIDSTLIAHIAKKLGRKPTLYYGGIQGYGKQKDLQAAQQTAKELGLKLKTNIATQQDIPRLIENVVKTIDDNNFIKVSVALPIYLAAQRASKDCNVVLSGVGAEYLFGGYQRYRDAHDINKDCLSALRNTWFNDLYRDDTSTMKHGVELRTPFLDHDLIKKALTIPPQQKTGEHDKKILRKTAISLGLPKNIAYRKKVAAQYGSNSAKAIKKTGGKHINTYLSKHNAHKTRLVSLLSTGKDSCLATQRMIDYNYNIVCFATIHSENPDSYMSHTPKTQHAETISKKSNIPLLQRTSKGKKEEELEDYKKLLAKAKSEYGAEGVVTGAIRSEYQRQRIEQIADQVGLKTYTPLWRMNEEHLLKELIRRKFDVEIVKTAAMGLNEDWIGRKINKETLQDLKNLHRKYKVSIAGEGGEYETLTHNAPFMKNP